MNADFLESMSDGLDRVHVNTTGRSVSKLNDARTGDWACITRQSQESILDFLRLGTFLPSGGTFLFSLLVKES